MTVLFFGSEIRGQKHKEFERIKFERCFEKGGKSLFVRGWRKQNMRVTKIMTLTVFCQKLRRQIELPKRDSGGVELNLQ